MELTLQEARLGGSAITTLINLAEVVKEGSGLTSGALAEVADQARRILAMRDELGPLAWKLECAND